MSSAPSTPRSPPVSAIKRLELVSIESTGSDTYLMRYRFKAPRSAVCNGRAIVTTTTDAGTTLISRINALDGC
jgi:hypothetical protein